MNPISNQQFSHDAVKYVYQENSYTQGVQGTPSKVFKVTSPDKATKAKKDVKKGKKQDDGGKIRPYDMMSG